MLATLNLLADSSLSDEALEEAQTELNAFFFGDPERFFPKTQLTRDASGRNLAIVPMHGPMMNRAGVFQRLFAGHNSPQHFARLMRAASQNGNIEKILIDVDSPGGTVAGTTEAAEAVDYAVRRKGAENVTAFANGQMASSAYWIASRAGQIIADPTALVGSIGILTAHVDRTGAAEKAGVKVSYFRSGQHKGASQPFEGGISEAEAAEVQRLVSKTHDEFVASVEDRRGALREEAKAGKVYVGAEAQEVGLIDGVGSFESHLEGTASGGRRVASLELGGKVEETIKAVNLTELLAELKASKAEGLQLDKEGLGKLRGLLEAEQTLSIAAAEALSKQERVAAGLKVLVAAEYGEEVCAKVTKAGAEAKDIEAATLAATAIRREADQAEADRIRKDGENTPDIDLNDQEKDAPKADAAKQSITAIRRGIGLN